MQLWGTLLLDVRDLRFAICPFFKAADVGSSAKVYRDFAKSQIHYMLGDTGRSYVIGFGEIYPKQPYHAAR